LLPLAFEDPLEDIIDITTILKTIEGERDSVASFLIVEISVL
jgi:hypothetical protein